MDKRGFSLLELLAIIAIFGTLAAVAIPTMSSWFGKNENKEIARDILSGLRQARSIAVSQNKTVTAVFNTGTHELTYDGNTKEFPDHVLIEVSADESDWSSTSLSTVFQPQGSCTDLIYIRVNGDSNLEVKIDSTATGLARLD